MKFKPSNKEIERLFDRLMNYPFCPVDGNIAQSLSRCKKIRYLNQNRKNPLIYIRGGVVGLSPKIKVKKKGDFFDFEIF